MNYYVFSSSMSVTEPLPCSGRRSPSQSLPSAHSLPELMVYSIEIVAGANSIAYEFKF